jgi:hypothetical protein
MPDWKRLAVLGVALAIGPMISGCVFLRRPPADTPVQQDTFLQAKGVLRGQARGILLAANCGVTGIKNPPNSLAALRAAIDLGVPMVVVDVGQTADGIWVLDLDHGLCGGSASGKPLEKCRRSDLPASTRPGSPSEVPTLSDALELARGRLLVGIRPFCGALQDLVQLIDGLEMADQVILFATRPIDAQVATGLLQKKTSQMFLFDALAPDQLSQMEVRPPWPTLVQLGPETLSLDSMSRVQAMGARVLVHQRGLLLVRIGSALDPYYRMGVVVLLTDWPRQLVPEMKRLNPAASGRGEGIISTRSAPAGTPPR